MTTATSTIVFADVVGSTALRARLGEEAADRLFRAHQRALGEVVGAHLGRVVKTAGDGTMAAFDSATDAVRAAVAMQQCSATTADPLRLRVGVAAGDVSWEEGDCSGLPVVTAARLEARAEAGQILVSSLVRSLAGDRSAASFASLGPLELKDLAEPVEAFEVDWSPPEAVGGSAADLFTIPCPAPIGVAPAFAFVGREVERHELDVAWAAVRSGERRTVLIGGEAGAGKTRLAFEFARRCLADGAAVLLGVCDTELALPYQPWVQVLDHLARALPAEVAASLADDLAEVSVAVPQLERVVPGLRRPPPGDPETERYRLFNAVDALLADTARRWPTVVVIDDLHWAGAPTLALLRHLARSGTASRLLVIGTFRDTGDEITDPLASCLADLRRTETTSRLRLPGLDRATVERFVADAVGHDLDSELRALAAVLAEHSGGNAFYVGELWRHVVAGGVVARRGDRWTVRRSAELGVPDSVREVVAGRVTKLSGPARSVVELAAIAGQRVDLRVLHRAVDLPGVDVGAGLDELVEAKLLIEVGGVLPTYQFAHAIVRDTVEQMISPSGRTRLHQRVAEATEAVYEADRRPVLAELARHFSAAAALGGATKALYYSRRAGSQALRSVAYDEAISHLNAARELSPPESPDRVDVLLDLGAAKSRHGLARGAMATFAEAFRAARALDLVPQAVQAAAGFDQASQYPGLPGGPAVEMVSEALALVGDEDSPLRTRLQASLARGLALAGRLEEAELVGEEALANARRHGDPDVLVAALQSALVYSGEPRRYLREARELAELGLQLGDQWTYAFGRGSQVRAHLWLAQLDDARATLSELWQAADRGRFVFYRYQALTFAGALALVDGRFDEAERLAEQGRELASTTQADYVGVYGLHMFVIRREQGRLGEVAPVLRLAAALNADEPVWRPGLAACFAEMGMLDDARREFDRLAPGNFAAVPRDAMWPCCLVFLADVCVALGDRDRAELLYRELEVFRGQTVMVAFTICLGPAERLMGNLAALLGRRDDAQAHFAAALELAERSGSPVWRAHVQHDWAVALGDRPDLLAAAEATATELGMRALAERCRRPAPPAEPAPPTWPHGLSDREVEVLRLVATGLSNRAIGERLFISQNTSANHVRSILQKTGSANRAEATAYAARHGLLSS